MDTFREPCDSHDEEELSEEYQLLFGVIIEAVATDIDGCFQNMSSTKSRLKKKNKTEMNSDFKPTYACYDSDSNSNSSEYLLSDAIAWYYAGMTTAWRRHDACMTPA